MFNWYLILKDKSLQILVKLEATYLIHISNSFEDYIPNREKNKQKKKQTQTSKLDNTSEVFLLSSKLNNLICRHFIRLHKIILQSKKV